MKISGVLRTLAAVGLVLLSIALVAWAVSAVDTVVKLALLALLIALLYGIWLMLSRHISSDTVIEVDLDKGVVEQKGTNPIARALNSGSLELRDAVDAIDRATGDDRVNGMVARLGNGKIGIAAAQEIRDAIGRFRAAGKKTTAFSETFGEGSLAITDYYLATAFESIHLQPSGSVGIEGLVATAPFLRRFLDKIGVFPDMGHREEYKAAKYLLTESEMVDAHREATTAVIEDHFEQIVSGISEGRNLEAERVRSLIDNAPLTSQEALEAGLVDALGFRDEAYESALDGDGRLLYASVYLKKAKRVNSKGKRIALIHGTGSIHRGSSTFDPLSRSSSMGADDIAKAFREALEDDKVKAIVFRVDSPGGSAVGSDIIGREVARARAVGKPVVVSMGSVAGSGGYWVSAPADHIVAQPGTVTGSIGVVSGKLARGEAWRKLGVDFGQVHVGANATTWDATEPFTDSQRERNEAFLDWIYDDFLEHVANGRGMTVDEVRPIAKGRVWTGERALELGLVDELGGLYEAIARAKDLAEISESDGIQLRVYPEEPSLPLPKKKENSEPIGVAFAQTLGAIEAIGREMDAGHRLTMPDLWIR